MDRRVKKRDGVGRHALRCGGNGLDVTRLTGGGRPMQAHEERVGEGDGRGEAKENYNEKKNLLKSEGLEADEHHIGRVNDSTGRAKQ